MSTDLTGSGAEVVGQPIHSSFTNAAHKIAELVHANDGRVFRYCLNGAATMVAGNLQQRQAEITGDQDRTPAAAAIGDTSLVLTSTVSVDANEYIGGWAMVTLTPGEGRQYQIRQHAAFAAAAPTFLLDDPIEVALTTSSRIDLVHNPYNDVIIYPSTSATGGPVGISVHPIVIAEYGWLCVGGVASCLVDSTAVVGLAVTAADGSVDGAVDDVTHATEAPVGIALTGIADTQFGPIKVNLI